MKDIKYILSKFKLASHPVKFLRLMQEIEQLFKACPHVYPADKRSSTLYLKVEDKVYCFQHKRFRQVEGLPQRANVIKVSQAALARVAETLGKSEADINALLKALYQEEELTVFQNVRDALADGFSSNISLRQVMRNLTKG